MNTKKIVITGGPGTGKTSLIIALEKAGFFCFEEVIRTMTKNAKMQEGAHNFASNPIVSVSDPMDFNTRILEGRINQFKKEVENSNQTVFYDRGIPDVLAYMDFFSQQYGNNFKLACSEHIYDHAFILPPWKDIYISDNERYESFEEATNIHKCLEKTYMNYGYQLINVPFGNIQERTDFILDHIK